MNFLNKLLMISTVFSLMLIINGCGRDSFFGQNLIKNGDAEAGPTVLFDKIGERQTPQHWTDVEGMMCISQYDKYEEEYGPIAESEARGRGKNYFWGGKVAHSVIEQIADVSDVSKWIDKGVVKFELSGILGGYKAQNDRAFLLAEFLDKNDVVLGTAQIGPVTNSDRNNVTTMVFRKNTGNVPIGAQSIRFELNAIRTEGTDNDGYADKLSMVLRK